MHEDIHCSGVAWRVLQPVQARRGSGTDLGIGSTMQHSGQLTLAGREVTGEGGVDSGKHALPRSTRPAPIVDGRTPHPERLELGRSCDAAGLGQQGVDGSGIVRRSCRHGSHTALRLVTPVGVDGYL